MFEVRQHPYYGSFVQICKLAAMQGTWYKPFRAGTNL